MDRALIRRSVTAGDYNSSGGSPAGVWRFYTGSSGPSLLSLPPFWSPARDARLRASVYLDDTWAVAVGKAVSKYAARGWDVKGMSEGGLRERRVRELLLNADMGRGWLHFIQRHLRAYLLNDNGAFIEVIRATGAAGGRIIGLAHLASERCQRTGDPDNPVIYTDRKGRLHLLKAHQVIILTDLPGDDEEHFGVGLCAASRAYKTIATSALVASHIAGKVEGKGRAHALHFVGGMSAGQLQQSLKAYHAEMGPDPSDLLSPQEAPRAQVERGGVIIPLAGDVPPTVVTIPLSSLPEGYDAKQERDNAAIIYAGALGIAVQDIQPLSGQGLGTGTQTIVLDEAAEGQGLAAWAKAFTHVLNTFILPDSVTFSWSSNDIRDKKASAEVREMGVRTRAAQIGSGEITREEARALAADEGAIPREWLSPDPTRGDEVRDDINPPAEPEAGTAQAPQTAGDSGAEPEPGGSGFTAREKAEPPAPSTISSLIDSEEAAAVKLAKRFKKKPSKRGAS